MLLFFIQHFERCPAITDALLARLFSGNQCKSLQHLGIVHCTGVTDMAVVGLANASSGPTTSSTALRSVDFRGFAALTDKGLAFAVQASHNLEEILLDGCTQLTDVGLRYLANCCPKLKRVSVADIDCLTDRGVLALVTAGTGLAAVQQHADVNDDAYFGLDTGELTGVPLSARPGPMARKTHKLPAPPPPCLLEFLDFSGVFHIGDVGISYIAARCRRLRTIVLRGCVDVSDTGMLELWQRCPVLQDVRCDIKFILPTATHDATLKGDKSRALRAIDPIGTKLKRSKRGGPSALGDAPDGDGSESGDAATGDGMLSRLMTSRSRASRKSGASVFMGF